MAKKKPQKPSKRVIGEGCGNLGHQPLPVARVGGNIPEHLRNWVVACLNDYNDGHVRLANMTDGVMALVVLAKQHKDEFMEILGEL